MSRYLFNIAFYCVAIVVTIANAQDKFEWHSGPPICIIKSSTPNHIRQGESYEWTIEVFGEYTSVVFDGQALKERLTRVRVTPEISRAYVAIVAGPGGRSQCGNRIWVDGIAATAPPTGYLITAPFMVSTPGQAVDLILETYGEVTSAQIDGREVDPTGGVLTVYPTRSGYYDAVLQGPAGVSQLRAYVNVLDETTDPGIPYPYYAHIADRPVQLIHNQRELEQISRGGNYRLAGDIYLDATFLHSRDIAHVILDGAGYAIRGLGIYRASSDSRHRLGLFGRIEDSLIKNLRIEDSWIVCDYCPSTYAGLLAGLMIGSRIHNVRTSGVVRGAISWIGGLVGYAGFHPHAAPSKVGEGLIINTTAEIDIEFEGQNVGGLVGENYVAIVSSTALGIINSNRERSLPSSAGGLVGSNYGAIVDSTAIVNVARSLNQSGNVGGLAAASIGSIVNSIAKGSATGPNAGGLANRVHGRFVGVLPGVAIHKQFGSGLIVGSHAFWYVDGIYEVGGLVGYALDAYILRSSARGEVITTSAGLGFIGGLVGRSINSTIRESFATGDVYGLAHNTLAGGLAGLVDDQADTAREYINFPRNRTNTIEDCFARGNLYANISGASILGGLICSRAKVRRSYSVGNVGFPAVPSPNGGLVCGTATGSTSVEDSYWDIETSLRTTSGGGVGKTTAEMQRQTTFQGWDFERVWQIAEGSYPTLRRNQGP